MLCPRCKGPGKKYYGGYCSKVHQQLDKKPMLLRLTCANCGRPVIRTSSQVSKSGRVFCRRCPKNAGEQHYKWREGQYINPAGYRLILINNEYKLEHRHTWEQANSACLLPEAAGKVSIHHINMNKLDNRPENLVLLSNQIHGRIHRLIDLKKFDDAKCLLIQCCEQQAYFASHLEALEAIKDSSLQEILSMT